MSDSNTRKPRVTTDDFIRRSKLVHGDKYDYSKTIYQGNRKKTNITCKIHGEFYQISGNHLNGNGCPKCSKNKRRTKEEVICEFNLAHNGRYDYSMVVFKRMTIPVKIICKDHGVFEQLPYLHINGAGCHKCSGVARYTRDEVLNKFKEYHGERYDYSAFEFNGMNKKAKIICRVHGEFEQLPYHHAKGLGCKKCGHIKQSRTSTKDIEHFISSAIKSHGFKYDYSKSIYKGAKRKIEIICRTHGSFMQEASSHIIGNGCPSCADEIKFGFDRSSYIHACNTSNHGMSNLYVIRMFNNDESFFKVGITLSKVKKRFSGMRAYNHEIIHIISGDAGYIWDLEKAIHKLLKNESYKPNVFFEGHTECFSNITESVTKLISGLKSTNQLQLIA